MTNDLAVADVYVADAAEARVLAEIKTLRDQARVIAKRLDEITPVIRSKVEDEAITAILAPDGVTLATVTHPSRGSLDKAALQEAYPELDLNAFKTYASSPSITFVKKV